MGQQMTENNNPEPMTEINPENTLNHAMPDHENFYENSENIVEMQTITIHGVKCLSDMIKSFSNENILDASITFMRVLVKWWVGDWIWTWAY